MSDESFIKDMTKKIDMLLFAWHYLYTSYIHVLQYISILVFPRIDLTHVVLEYSCCQPDDVRIPPYAINTCSPSSITSIYLQQYLYMV